MSLWRYDNSKMIITLVLIFNFMKIYINFVNVTSGEVQIINLKASREYILDVMEEGVENIVSIGPLKTWPSDNFLLVHLRRKCHIDNLIKTFLLCMAPICILSNSSYPYYGKSVRVRDTIMLGENIYHN